MCQLLDAQLTLRGQQGVRTMPAQDFSIGVYETALQTGELLTKVTFPAQLPTMRWGFHEISRRHGDFAMAGAIVGLELDSDQRLQDLRLVVFAVGDRAQRLESVLQHFLGQPLDAAAVDAMGLCVAAEVKPRSDLHASAALRLELVHACVVRALLQALAPLEKDTYE